MFDWLFEGDLAVILLLAAALVVFLWLWWNRRERRNLLAAGIVLLLLLVYLALDRLVETDREQIGHRVEGMAAAVQARDLDRMFQHISDQFRSQGGRDKKQLRELARELIQSGTAAQIDVWDFRFEDGVARDKGQARVSFAFKVHGNHPELEGLFYRCEATFDFHPEHGWRMRSCKIVDPVNNKETPYQP
jgi:type II secretory pathway component PulM